MEEGKGAKGKHILEDFGHLLTSMHRDKATEGTDSRI